MIYAVPNNQGQVANHFMKAPSFSVFSDTELLDEITHQANHEQSCNSKIAIFEQLCQLNVDAVIVKNIGEKALNRLLAMGIKVFKTNARVALNTISQSPMIELKSLELARPSLQHSKKHSHKACCKNSIKQKRNNNCCSEKPKFQHS
ncbi:NifB/NifX family molybdenum-iron cluster-binding protein [Agarivorans sp. JK6]|uniref:NifB/NifX family molybdenum-iron cluster-binding protein n=1 Tax=Agarivorans sp. JK6 TaxID=2997426 RepID=UPI003872E391